MGCDSCNSVKSIKSGCKNNHSCGRCNKFSVFDWLSDIEVPNNNDVCPTIELSFKNGRKKYYDNNKNIFVKIGDPVLVKTEYGYDIGLLSLKGELVRLQLKRKKIREDEIKSISKIPNTIELSRWHESIALEKSTLLKSRKIVKELNLKMKISDVEYQADGKRAIFYYLSENRIDFRELIKVFSKNFNIKILMRQVGARQESSILGGIGSCGRELCCASWLMDTRTVSISAARYQKLSLNPNKLTGQCGKLKCCLNYELENYMLALKKFPNTKTLIKTKKGSAGAQKVDIFKKIIWYNYIDYHQEWIKVPIEAAEKMIALNKSGTNNFLIEDFVTDTSKA